MIKRMTVLAIIWLAWAGLVISTVATPAYPHYNRWLVIIGSTVILALCLLADHLATRTHTEDAEPVKVPPSG